MAVQKKNKGWWVVPIMAFALIYAAFAYTAQSEELYTINLELTELRAKIQKEKERQQSSIKERDEISSDESIEKIAREKLGMVRDGERVFIDTNK
ncbi:MAG TPA: septum formation initiator family protein [Ruminiclostridium sp.]|jgi:cell division protein FtsL|nr:septum formation initiator family protein [Ruminiclostridium sp.]